MRKLSAKLQKHVLRIFMTFAVAIPKNNNVVMHHVCLLVLIYISISIPTTCTCTQASNSSLSTLHIFLFHHNYTKQLPGLLHTRDTCTSTNGDLESLGT